MHFAGLNKHVFNDDEAALSPSSDDNTDDDKL